MNVYAKTIAAFFGAGVPGGLAQLILYMIGVVALPPDALQSIVTGLILGLVAAATVYFSPANQITTAQVVASAKAGELQTALAGATGRVDATAVAEAITALPVKTSLVAAGAPATMLTPAPVEILKPAPAPLGDSMSWPKPKPVPGGDGKAHSSTDTAKSRAISKKGK